MPNRQGIYYLDPAKLKARKIARRAHPTQKPCEVCGRANRTFRHHDDYNKPEEIRFLCGSCHQRHHRGTL
jgi:hypothetical protein